jgi:hypothetical protein
MAFIPIFYFHSISQHCEICVEYEWQILRLNGFVQKEASTQRLNILFQDCTRCKALKAPLPWKKNITYVRIEPVMQGELAGLVNLSSLGIQHNTCKKQPVSKWQLGLIHTVRMGNPCPVGVTKSQSRRAWLYSIATFCFCSSYSICLSAYHVQVQRQADTI